jgi:voltage-gated potassium channel
MFNLNLIKSIRWRSFLGMGMVTKEDSLFFELLNSLISSTYIILAIVLMWQWQAVVHGQLTLQSCIVCDWLIWGCLLIAYALLMFFVKNKKRFVVHNWFLLAVLLVGLFFLFNGSWAYGGLRNFRPVLAVIILIPALPFLARFFFDGRLWTTVIAALAIVCVFGLLVAGIDPGIKSAADGLWWALATISTVGYGDVVPHSMPGRLVGALLVIVGLGVFVVITANVLSMLWRNEKAGNGNQKDFLVDEVERLHQNQKTIQESLSQIQKKLDRLK